MKATIRGNDYHFQVDDLLDLNQWVQVKRQTGLGMKSFIETVQKFGTATDESGIPDVLDTEEGLNALRVLIWAIHLRAGITSLDGKPLTIERANADINMAEFMASIDFQDEPDPTGADREVGPSSSKTSKKTSTTTS
jgi:hypothetical protein